MVPTPLPPRPCGVHQMHLRPEKRTKPGSTSRHTPVPGAQHPHGLDPSPHHRTTRWVADTVPDDPKSHKHPPADGGTRGSPQRARLTAFYTLLCTHADEPRPRQHTCNGRPSPKRPRNYVPHPRIPATCSHPTPNRLGPAPQTPVLPIVRPPPATYHPTQDPPPPARAPSTAHNTSTTRTSTRGTAHTPGSMRTPQVPCLHATIHPWVPPNGRQLHAPSVYANGCHRRPCPTSRTTGSA